MKHSSGCDDAQGQKQSDPQSFFFFLFLHVTLSEELLIKLSNKRSKLFANLELYKHIFFDHGH